MRKITLSIVLISVFLLSLTMHKNRGKREFPLPLDKAQLTSNELIFRMSQEGDSLGYSKISFEVNPDQILVSEEAKVKSSFRLHENMTSYLDKESLEMDSVLVQGSANGKSFDARVLCENGHIRGTSNYTKLYSPNAVVVDSTTKQLVIERLSSLFLFPPAIDFGEMTEFKYAQFSTLDGGFREVTITKTTDHTVTVPSGTYETYKLELTGGAAQQIFYISKDTPRKIVKVEFKDNNWIYELL